MKITLMNKISPVGLSKFDSGKYEIGENLVGAQGMMVRSAGLLDAAFDPELQAIARAGAGVNNIPLDRCADEGIVVFNTPGANANAVKELALCALLLASRGICEGSAWVEKDLAGDENAAKAVEKGKGAFAGVEIMGKTLGIIGLGAIGRLLANAAVALGMKVVGVDPFLSEAAAKQLDPAVKVLAANDEVYAAADYISIHVPSLPTTKGMINAEAIAKMKDGVRILNLARADLVNFADLKVSLESGKVAKYVTDFPTPDSIGVKGIVNMPHLGASTEEAEDNCAAMAADELIDYLENGNVKNSVNFPALSFPRTAKNRICVLGKADTDEKEVFEALLVKPSAQLFVRGKAFYAVIDTDAETASSAEAIKAVSGVVRVIVK